jgi:hypothetical protein
MSEKARYGWESDFPQFERTPSYEIKDSLKSFLTDASPQQVRAWDASIPPLQREVREVLAQYGEAQSARAILEYELPLEFRRPDVIFLVGKAIVVLELKGKLRPTMADLDQASAYARDLRCYHRACENRDVIPVLLLTQAKGYLGIDANVHVSGPDAIDGVISRLAKPSEGPSVRSEEFLSENAYRPLPKLIQAARELFEKREIRSIWRASALTDPAVDCISTVIHQAAATRTKHLILLTGVPGSGKTLVGLRIVHSAFLDDLVVPRENGEKAIPAAFLSGNGPLVEVLQYEFKGAGGGGKAFVRGIKEYIAQYSTAKRPIPPQHVLVFDEAQRAFDAEQVKEKHSSRPGFQEGRSEPEHFVDFASRIPEWCVVLGLIGQGQEIHIGEEAGLGQWRTAIAKSSCPSDWTVHIPPGVAEHFSESCLVIESDPRLNLDNEIRFHLAKDIHSYVESLLSDSQCLDLPRIATELERNGYHLRLSRDLNEAKSYLKERYSDALAARFGLLASSKDRDLIRFGIQNDFQSTKRVHFGPWYSESEDAFGRDSCRKLESCVTEFGAQGLELDAALLAWGTDFVRRNGRWTNELARGYKKKARVKNPFQLRKNSYRVLLTRSRDAVLVYVPPLSDLDETYLFLIQSGFKLISRPQSEPESPSP